MPEEVIDYLRQPHPRKAAAPAARLEQDDAERVSLKEEARMIHEECRMVLPGIQALFGFQLIAVFNRPFFDLSSADRIVHLVSLLLIAIAIGLIMAPAAHKRLSDPDIVSRHWIRLASRDITSAMIALMVAIGLDVYLVTLMIADDMVVAVLLGAAAGMILGWLWFALPLVRAKSRRP